MLENVSVSKMLVIHGKSGSYKVFNVFNGSYILQENYKQIIRVEQVGLEKRKLKKRKTKVGLQTKIQSVTNYAQKKELALKPTAVLDWVQQADLI